MAKYYVKNVGPMFVNVGATFVLLLFPLRWWASPFLSKQICYSTRLIDRSGGGPETLYHEDDALLYIAYVMLIWAAPIPADRWHCSPWP